MTRLLQLKEVLATHLKVIASMAIQSFISHYFSWEIFSILDDMKYSITLLYFLKKRNDISSFITRISTQEKTLIDEKN